MPTVQPTTHCPVERMQLFADTPSSMEAELPKSGGRQDVGRLAAIKARSVDRARLYWFASERLWEISRRKVILDNKLHFSSYNYSNMRALENKKFNVKSSMSVYGKKLKSTEADDTICPPKALLKKSAALSEFKRKDFCLELPIQKFFEKRNFEMLYAYQLNNDIVKELKISAAYRLNDEHLQIYGNQVFSVDDSKPALQPTSRFAVCETVLDYLHTQLNNKKDFLNTYDFCTTEDDIPVGDVVKDAIDEEIEKFNEISLLILTCRFQPTLCTKAVSTYAGQCLEDADLYKRTASDLRSTPDQDQVGLDGAVGYELLSDVILILKSIARFEAEQMSATFSDPKTAVLHTSYKMCAENAAFTARGYDTELAYKGGGTTFNTTFDTAFTERYGSAFGKLENFKDNFPEYIKIQPVLGSVYLTVENQKSDISTLLVKVFNEETDNFEEDYRTLQSSARESVERLTEGLALIKQAAVTIQGDKNLPAEGLSAVLDTLDNLLTDITEAFRYQMSDLYDQYEKSERISKRGAPMYIENALY